MMMKQKVALIAMALALGACAQVPESAQRTVVANDTQAAAAQQTLEVAVADHLYELVYSQRQQAVFVAAPDMDDNQSSRILRLDPQTLQIQAEIVLPHRGFGVALDEANNRLYVGHGFDGAISAIDTETNQVVKTLSLMQKIPGSTAARPFTHSLRELIVDTANARLYLPGLANQGKPDSVLFVVNTRSFTLEKVIPGLGFEATGATLDADNQRLYVSNLQGQLHKINTQTLTLEKTFEVQADQLINLAFDPKTNRVLGVDQGIAWRTGWMSKGLGRYYTPRSEGHQLVALNTDTGEVVALAGSQKYPVGILHDAASRRVYVTNFNGIRVPEGHGALTVFDSDSYRLLDAIALPPHPNSLAYDAAHRVLYVAVKNDETSKKAGLKEKVVRIQF